MYCNFFLLLLLSGTFLSTSCKAKSSLSSLSLPFPGKFAAILPTADFVCECVRDLITLYLPPIGSIAVQESSCRRCSSPQLNHDLIWQLPVLLMRGVQNLFHPPPHLACFSGERAICVRNSAQECQGGGREGEGKGRV